MQKALADVSEHLGRGTQISGTDKVALPQRSYAFLTDTFKKLDADIKADSSVQESTAVLLSEADAQLKAIKRMIRLSRVINSLEDTEELSDTDLQKLNTLEAFDYTINDYFLPVAAGDVFTNSKGEWFVLIGQDCDMARSITRTPKNALAELLPAKVRHQTEFDKWANDLRSASIYSFRKTIDAECEVLQVIVKNE